MLTVGFFFASRRRHTRCSRDWSSDVCSSDLDLSFADRKIFDRITWAINDRGRVGLVGDNGTGKTTLLRAILGGIDLDEGSIGVQDRKRVAIGYLPQDLVELHPLPLLDYLRRKSGAPG